MSIFTPVSSIAASTGESGQLDVAVQVGDAALVETFEQRPDQPARRLGAADERGRLLVGRRRRQELDAVLGGEIVELVGGAARIDQIRGEQRVLLRAHAQRLRVVHDEIALDEQRNRCDDDVIAVRDGGAILERRVADDAAEVELALAPADLDPGDLHRRGRDRGVELVDAIEERAELEAAEDLLELRAVGRLEHELRRVAVDVEVAPHRRELLRRARETGVLGDVLAARGRELVGMLDDRFERAVLGDQLAGCLVADAGNTRDVVGGVALQPDEVRHLLGRDAVPGLHPLGRVDVHVGDPARSHHQTDVLAAELERIAVGRDDARLDSRRVGTRRERRDDVVGLPALELEVPVAERLDDRTEVRELLAEQIRHRPAALLVDDVRRLGDRSAMHRP